MKMGNFGKAMIALIMTLLIVGVVADIQQSEADRSASQSRVNEIGLIGEHPLKKMERLGAIEGSVSGNFFLGIGSFNSTLGPELKLQFYWEPKPAQIIATALPYSKFRFVVDNSKESPTVEFVFKKWWINRNSIPEDYSSPMKINLNEFIKDDYLEVAIIRISELTLKKEVYLPITQ